MVIIIFSLTVMQPLLLLATTIITHLTTQQVSHEIIDLELIVLLDMH